MPICLCCVFPAQAGMNRSGTTRAHSSRGVPRAGGDEPQFGYDGSLTVGVFPAQAGMNRCYRSERGIY